MWQNKKGFTLIELLVVIGILMVLVAIVLIAVNPSEQLRKTADVSEKTVAVDLSDAAKEYFATYQEYPWDKNAACKSEVDNGGALSTMPDCLQELINSGKLQSDYTSKNDVSDMQVSKCGKAAVVCYDPKSKIEQADAETHYDKYGVNDPGCPGNGANCYWCHPLGNPQDCDAGPTPTPTGSASSPSPTPTPTFTPTPTVTPIPTAPPTSTVTPTPTLTPTPTMTPTPTPQQQQTYALDDTRFFQTYAVLTYPAPSFSPNWEIDVSFRPDFGGTVTTSSIGYYSYGVAATADSDTILSVAYAAEGNFGSSSNPVSPSYKAQIKLTSKHVAFISMPFEWKQYAQGCGKTIYWRVVGWPGDSSGLIGPTYSNVVDCTTKVGAFNATDPAPLNWYIYYPYINSDGSVQPGQPYNATMDANGDGKIDWTDYIILSLTTKMRAGGWFPPE